MAKFIKLEVGNEEYFIGFSNRASISNAVRQGMEKDIKNMEKLDTTVAMTKLVRYGMLEKHPNMTENKAEEILNKYIEENLNEDSCVDISKIVEFITEQYQAFSGLPTGKKKVKKLEIVDM